MTASAGIVAQQTILGCCAEGGSVEGRDRLPVQEGLPWLMHKIISASGKLVISNTEVEIDKDLLPLQLTFCATNEGWQRKPIPNSLFASLLRCE